MNDTFIVLMVSTVDRSTYEVVVNKETNSYSFTEEQALIRKEALLKHIDGHNAFNDIRFYIVDLGDNKDFFFGWKRYGRF